VNLGGQCISRMVQKVFFRTSELVKKMVDNVKIRFFIAQLKGFPKWTNITNLDR